MFCKKWSQEHLSGSLYERTLHRLTWKEKFPHFNEYVLLYEKMRQEDSPNSWHNCMTYLKYYVLPFFLDKKKEPNINFWRRDFEEFREHLQKCRPLNPKNDEHLISFSTMNNIINSLNTFTQSMARRGLIEPMDKCRPFAQSRLNKRCTESVMDLFTQDKIYRLLKQRSPLSGDFFMVSLNTGMRLNEILGLSLADFFVHTPDSESLMKALSPYQMAPLGYISIDSQPARRISIRAADGTVPRKPLKGKKRIDPRDCRIIPIFDKLTFNTLVSLWNQQQGVYFSTRYGDNPSNYLLFDGLNRNIYARDLREVQLKARFPKMYSAHDARHTYSTWLAEKTGGNYTLCKMILGHSSINMTMRYVHIHGLIQKQLRSKAQLKLPLTMVS